ncbi:hypothetical protein I551_2456 [Mycobacterium ulcerans str. Harvey]|uniref:Uncharacterized protein n=1 Tax=Mycobacterium ulcerans str. Harvey TaxID=1299332 RepID=A0ABP3ALF7_MYCUL|nr:hypothetical protein I551_2456 [Mycobacterium ulcerans str. Harvey]
MAGIGGRPNRHVAGDVAAWQHRLEPKRPKPLSEARLNGPLQTAQPFQVLWTTCSSPVHRNLLGDLEEKWSE